MNWYSLDSFLLKAFSHSSRWNQIGKNLWPPVILGRDSTEKTIQLWGQSIRWKQKPKQKESRQRVQDYHFVPWESAKQNKSDADIYINKKLRWNQSIAGWYHCLKLTLNERGKMEKVEEEERIKSIFTVCVFSLTWKFQEKSQLYGPLRECISIYIIIVFSR